jgi:hypothetical protein
VPLTPRPEDGAAALLSPGVSRLLVLALVVGVTGVDVARSAGAETYTYDRRLGVVARAALAHASPKTPFRFVLRAYVRCYRDKRSFEEAYTRRSGESAGRVVAYYAGDGDVHLRNGTCRNVRAFLAGRRTVYTAGAFSILLHEALHRQGVRNERTTTCLANDAVRWGAGWLASSEAQSLRARNLAFTYTRLFAPPSYRMGKPDCLALARRKDWPAFARGGAAAER